jgi:DNA-binding CsgD family transcriptional regulator
MIDHEDKPDWIIRLRRRPAGLSVNHQDDGADMFEIICRMCGDDPALDSRQVSAELRQIRGCYPLRVGLVLFFQHQEFHDRADRRSGSRPPQNGRQVAGRPSQGCTTGKGSKQRYTSAGGPAGDRSPSTHLRSPDDPTVMRAAATPGCPGSSGQPCLEEPPAVTLVSVASLLEELIRLQKQTTELLREMAHTQENAAIQRQDIAGEPARLLASVPARPRPDEGRSERAGDPGPSAWLEEPLTQREEAVLRRLTTTLSLREISQELHVSRNTVKTHTQAIYRKLRVSNRRDAVQRARELALLTRRRKADTLTPRAS